MVMENLLVNKKLSKLYDRKGSLHGRLVVESSDVLLDQNLVNNLNISPLQISTLSKENFQIAIERDTQLLQQANIMDYSLLIGVDEEKQELVFGIIDYLSPYNWKKQAESFVKSLLLTGRNARPTVIKPYAYKERFLHFINSEFQVFSKNSLFAVMHFIVSML